MSASPPIPSREDGPPESLQGLQAAGQQQGAATSAPPPDPQEILKQKLNLFRALDELIENIGKTSNLGGKYSTQIKGLTKQWMMDEVRNTRERTPTENPRIPGMS